MNCSSSQSQLPRCFQSKSQQQNSMKFSQLKSSLMNCDIDFIINLLIQELQKTDKMQSDIKQMDRLLKLVEDQKEHLKITLNQKKQAFKQVCQTQQKNVQNIQVLEKQLFHMRHKFQLSKEQTQVHETTVEKKYRQLSKCMNEYVANTADIQEQFKRNFFILKNQNIRLHAENQNLNMSYNENLINYNILSKELENTKSFRQVYAQVKAQNQRLVKELHYHQQVQKELYEGVASIETERVGLQKQLQKVKQICQTSNTTNRQISNKYQQLLHKYREQQKQRSIIADNCKGSSQRIKQLQTCIIKQHQEYEYMGSEFTKFKKANSELEKSNIELLTQVAILQKRLIQSQADAHSLKDRNKILQQKITYLQNKNKQLKEAFDKASREKENQKGKSDLICIEIQNFMKQPQIILKSSSGKPMRDLTNIKSSKTMATSTSQSRTDRIYDQNIKPQ